MLSETIAELERLEKAMNDGSLPVSARACYRWDLTTALRTHARALLAAAKLSDKLPKYADTGEAFVPGRDEAWIAWHNVAFRCQIQKFRWAEKIQEWFCYVTENGCDGSSRFYSTRDAALAAAEKGSA